MTAPQHVSNTPAARLIDSAGNPDGPLRYRLCRLPVRLFHGALSGILLGCLLSLGAHFLTESLRHQDATAHYPPPAADTDSRPAEPPPATTAYLSGQTDSDGDGIPNSWETAYAHNPSLKIDADADFDFDGLTAKQEYDLHQATGGLYGNPLGAWRLETLSTTNNPPPGYDSLASLTLIETASNGLLLIRVAGRTAGATAISNFPHTYDPATAVWTRVLPPAEYPTIINFTATDVNSSGQVVGWFRSGGNKGFVWTPDSSSPDGGSSKLFFLNPDGPAPAPAIPWRISDSGHFIHSATPYYDGIDSLAADPRQRPLSLFPPGDWSQPALTDVNDYGEFVGTVFDPFSQSIKTFLVTPEGFFFVSALSWNDFREGYGGLWLFPPDIDLGGVQWTEMVWNADTLMLEWPTGYAPPLPPASYPEDVLAAAETIDLTSHETVLLCKTGDGAIKWWRGFEDPALNEYCHAWISLSSTSSAAHVNDWGEFAGLFTAEGGESYQWGLLSDSETDAGAWENWSSSTSGIFLFDGAYHLNTAAGSVHSISNDPCMIIGNGSPTSLWSDGVTAPFARFFPQGALTRPSLAKLADNGLVLTQRDSRTIELIIPDADADGDGIPDDWEAYHGLDPFDNSDAFLDPDEDGINNHGEFLLRSNPDLPPAFGDDNREIDLRPGIDTDGDGIPNVWEWQHGLDYQDPDDAALDPDRDGFTSLQEYHLNTDPQGAPAFRLREIGPFPGTAAATLSSATAGAGQVSPTGSQTIDEIFFPTTLTNNRQRPASWAQPQAAPGEFALHRAPEGDPSTTFIAAAPNGSTIASSPGNPVTFHYWPRPTDAPIPLSGATAANNANGLFNVVFSPSGAFLTATRRTTSNIYGSVLWRMPVSRTQTYTPIILPSTPAWGRTHVNDHGHAIAATTTAAPVLWTAGSNDTSTAKYLPLPAGATSVTITGITNQALPVIVGNANLPGGKTRATIWLPHASTYQPFVPQPLADAHFSEIRAISPATRPDGADLRIAGVSSILLDSTLHYQPFIAAYHPRSGSWKVSFPDSTVSESQDLTITAITTAGEAIGHALARTPSYRQVPTLWRHGSAFPLDSILPPHTGHTIDSVKAITPHGSLLATAYHEGSLTTILLTTDADTDGDGLPDAWENTHGMNPFAQQHPAADSDSDTLTESLEFAYGCDPRNPDTDGDGMPDGWEVKWGINPLDPSDAPLDPDGDGVTNLREFQIDTNPIGFHRIRLLHADGANSYASPIAHDDRGRVILNSWDTDLYQTETTADGLQHELYTYRNTLLTPAVDDTITPTELPSDHSSQIHNGNWTTYEDSGTWHSYYLNPATAAVHGQGYSYTHGYDGITYSSTEDSVLLPNAHDSSSAPILLARIEDQLRALPAPVLAADETLSAWPQCASPDGTRRIHATSAAQTIMLDENGAFLATMPPGYWFSHLTNSGLAVARSNTRVPAAGTTAAYNRPDITLCYPDGYLRTVPLIPPGTDPAASPFANSYITAIDDDGTVLITASRATDTGATVTDHWLVATRGGVQFTRLRTPGFAWEYISSLSQTNRRLLGCGVKPWHTTPDGTCIRLEALRIVPDDAAAAPPHGYPLLGAIHPDIHPCHITSDGIITAISTDSASIQTFIQLVPHNDADNDGIPDDYEEEIGSVLGINSDALDLDRDYDGDGYALRDELRFGTSDADYRSSPAFSMGDEEGDNDGDGIINARDANPDNGVIDWHKGPEPRFVAMPVKDSPVMYSEYQVDTAGFIDFSEEGRIIYQQPGQGLPWDPTRTFFLGSIRHQPKRLAAPGDIAYPLIPPAVQWNPDVDDWQEVPENRIEYMEAPSFGGELPMAGASLAYAWDIGKWGGNWGGLLTWNPGSGDTVPYSLRDGSLFKFVRRDGLWPSAKGLVESRYSSTTFNGTILPLPPQAHAFDRPYLNWVDLSTVVSFDFDGSGGTGLALSPVIEPIRLYGTCIWNIQNNQAHLEQFFEDHSLAGRNAYGQIVIRRPDDVSGAKDKRRLLVLEKDNVRALHVGGGLPTGGFTPAGIYFPGQIKGISTQGWVVSQPFQAEPMIWTGSNHVPLWRFATTEAGDPVTILEAHKMNTSGAICVTAILEDDPTPRLFVLLPYEVDSDSDTDVESTPSAPLIAPDDFRKVSPSGRPYRQNSPQDKSEIDLSAENTFVDAFTRHLRHDTSHVFAPVPSSELALQVTMSVDNSPVSIPVGKLMALGSSAATPHLYQAQNLARILRLGAETAAAREIGPFGMGMSTSLGAKAEVAPVFRKPRPGDPPPPDSGPLKSDRVFSHYKVTVPDESGAIYEFHSPDLGAFTQAPSTIPRQNAIFATLARDATGNLVLTKKFGTTLRYSWVGTAPAATLAAPAYDRTDPHRLRVLHFAARIASVSDRHGVRLDYTYPAVTATVPSRIAAAGRPGMEILIRTSAHTFAGGGTPFLLIDSITDPRGFNTTFSYRSHNLCGGFIPALHTVTKPDGSVVRYGFTDRISSAIRRQEGFLRPMIPAEFGKSPADTAIVQIKEDDQKPRRFTFNDDRIDAIDLRLNLTSIEDGLGNRHTFEYEPASATSLVTAKVAVKASATHPDIPPDLLPSIVANQIASITDSMDDTFIHQRGGRRLARFVTRNGETSAADDPHTLIYEIASSAGPDIVAKVILPGNIGTSEFTAGLPDNDPLPPGIIVTGYGTPGIGPSIKPLPNVTIVTDAAGKQTRYEFKDIFHLTPPLPPGTARFSTEDPYNPQNPVTTKAVGIAYTTLQISDHLAITDPDNHSPVTYTFSPEAGLALATATAKNGTTLNYQYGDAIPVSGPSRFATIPGRFSAVSFARSNNPIPVFAKFNEPTLETRSSADGALTLASSYRYDPESRIMTSATDPRGNETTTLLDSRKRRTDTQTYQGAAATGTLVSHTKYDYGNTTFQAFVTRQTTRKITSPQFPDPAWVTDLVTEYQPDAFGRVWKSRVAPATPDLDLTTVTTYDNAGNKLTVTDPQGYSTSFQYDVVGRLLKVNYPDLNTKTFAYDTSGRIIRETDGAGHSLLWQYDPLGRPVKSAVDMNGNRLIDALDLVTVTHYSPVGRPIAVTDPNGNSTRTAYDDLHRPIAITDPLDNTTLLDYSGPNAGSGLLNGPGYQPTRTLDPRGFLTIAEYDAFHRLTKEQKEFERLPETSNAGEMWKTRAPDLATRTETSHDQNGNPTETRAYRNATDAPTTAIVTRTYYDALNRPWQVATAHGTGLAHTTETQFTSTGLAWQTIAFKKHPTLETHIETEYDAAARPIRTWAPSPVTGLVDKSAIGPAASAQVTTQYDNNGNPVAIIDSLGRCTDTTYDSLNRPVKVEAPAEMDYSLTTPARVRATTRTFYDDAGNPWQTISPRGTVTITEYDNANRPWKTTLAPGTAYAAVTENTYDNNGNIIAVKDANGNTTRNQYDALNRLTATATNPATGDPSADFSNPAAADIVVVNHYDQTGNLIGVADGLATKSYTPGTRLWTLTESTGHVTAFAYDGLGRKISQTWDHGTAVAKSESWTYDALVQLTHKDARDVTAATTGYDALLRPTAIRHTSAPANPNITRDNTDYYYNGPGPLIATGHPNESSSGQLLRLVRHTHDRLGRVTSETSANIKHTYHYDILGNRVLVKYGNTNRSLISRHDALNRVTTIIDTTAPTVTDAASALAHTPAPGDSVTSYKYDTAGATVILDHANGTRTTNQYDILGRLRKTVTRATVAATAAILSACDYGQPPAGSGLPSGYDRLGNVVRMVETYSGAMAARTVVNTYDKTSRLLKETISPLPGGEGQGEGAQPTITTYGYDKAANRTSKVLQKYAAGAWATTAETFLYGTPAMGCNTNQLVGIGQPGVTPVHGNPATFRVRYTYDASGNRATRTADARTDTYTYDAHNRLVSLDHQTATDTARRGTHTYRYDYRTRRVQRTEPGPGGGTSRILSYSGGTSVLELTALIVAPTDSLADPDGDGLVNLLEWALTYDPLSGNHSLRFYAPGSYDAWAAAAITARISPAQLASWQAAQGEVVMEMIRGNEMGGGVGGLLYHRVASEAVHNLYNARGDLIAQTASAGTVTYQAQYEAFGTRPQETGAAAGRQRANTKEEDPTGLLNEGFRYRDLETGAFLTRDPAGFVDGPNVYTYVRQNPWSAFDPLGLWETGSYWGDVGQMFVGIGRAIKGTVVGIGTMVAHPVQTAKGVASAVASPIQTGKAIIADYEGKLETNAGLGEIVGEVIIGVATGGTLKVLDKAGDMADVAKISNKIEDAVDVAADVTPSARNVLRNTADDAAKGGASWFDDVARNATQNADSNKLVLGHFAREGTSYQKVAAHYKATYFKVDDWNAVTKGLSQDEIWRINETFLTQQVRQGKQVLFSHDPLKARVGSFFEREVNFLQDLGYGFRQKNQWTWEAFR